MSKNYKQGRLNLEYGVTREQACIMCHLSAECGDCCEKCRAQGRNGTCYGQICSLPSREYQGQRLETWLYIVANFRPDLRRFVPRKYWKIIEKKDNIIIVYNNVLPVKGYKAINICGIIFARNDANIDEETIRHEKIHTRQIYEMLVVVFYLWYLFEWLFKLIVYKSNSGAYEHIGFEVEAGTNDTDPDYLATRKHFAWISYM